VKDHYILLSPYYSILVKLIFGQRLSRAKRYFIEEVATKNILIIGGGDGLDYRHDAEALQGDYWELSHSMLNKARKNLANSNLKFHLGNFHAVEPEFDEIWLHFVLDSISDAELGRLVAEVKKALKPDGIVNFVDFYHPKKKRYRMINFLQISFFRIVASHIRKDIPDYHQFFTQNNLQKIAEKKWMDGWIKSQLWRNG
jgi:SAM-dependent methyltransferase